MIIETEWENPDTAKQYLNFCESYSIYRTASQDLVEFAEINQGMSVVDLACGTGIPTEVILKRLLNTGEVYSVDFSQPMLDIARSRISCSRVFFVKSTAESLDNHIPKKVDRVICNSAIVHTNMEASFKAISHVLKENGKFAFNLGARGSSICSRFIAPYDIGVLYQIMYCTAEKEYDYKKKRYYGDASLCYSNINNLLTKNGLMIESNKTTKTTLSLNEARELFLIPAMTEKCLSGLPYNKRKEIVEKACQEFDLTTTFIFTWMNYLVKRAVYPE